MNLVSIAGLNRRLGLHGGTQKVNYIRTFRRASGHEPFIPETFHYVVAPINLIYPYYGPLGEEPWIEHALHHYAWRIVPEGEAAEIWAAALDLWALITWNHLSALIDTEGIPAAFYRATEVVINGAYEQRALIPEIVLGFRAKRRNLMGGLLPVQEYIGTQDYFGIYGTTLVDSMPFYAGRLSQKAPSIIYRHMGQYALSEQRDFPMDFTGDPLRVIIDRQEEALFKWYKLKLHGLRLS